MTKHNLDFVQDENGEEGDQEGVWFWAWRSLHQHQGGVELFDSNMMQRLQDLTLHAVQVRAPKKLDEKQRALMQAYAELEPGIPCTFVRY